MGLVFLQWNTQRRRKNNLMFQDCRCVRTDWELCMQLPKRRQTFHPPASRVNLKIGRDLVRKASFLVKLKTYEEGKNPSSIFPENTLFNTLISVLCFNKGYTVPPWRLKWCRKIIYIFFPFSSRNFKTEVTMKNILKSTGISQVSSK